MPSLILSSLREDAQDVAGFHLATVALGGDDFRELLSRDDLYYCAGTPVGRHVTPTSAEVSNSPRGTGDGVVIIRSVPVYLPESFLGVDMRRECFSPKGAERQCLCVMGRNSRPFGKWQASCTQRSLFQGSE